MFLRTITLSVYKILEPPTLTPHVYESMNHIGGVIVEGGGGGSLGGQSSLLWTGLSCETWKLGWILREEGSLKRTTDGHDFGDLEWTKVTRSQLPGISLYRNCLR